MHLQFWGTSDAQGVPRMMCQCSVCTDEETMNQRKRPSLVFGHGKNKVLIDLGPDFRSQFLKFGELEPPQTVLVTHSHFDHIGGLGDYADLCLWNGVQARIISPPDVIDELMQRFPYLSNRACLEFIPSMECETAGWDATFHRVNHGHNGYSYGIRFDRPGQRWAYVSDAFDMNEAQLEPFQNCDLLILGTSFWNEQNAPKNSRSVYDVQEALELGQTLMARRLVFTHLSHDIDVVEKGRLLPSHARFAFDGLELEI